MLWFFYSLLCDSIVCRQILIYMRFMLSVSSLRWSHFFFSVCLLFLPSLCVEKQRKEWNSSFEVTLLMWFLSFLYFYNCLIIHRTCKTISVIFFIFVLGFWFRSLIIIYIDFVRPCGVMNVKSSFPVPCILERCFGNNLL